MCEGVLLHVGGCHIAIHLVTFSSLSSLSSSLSSSSAGEESSPPASSLPPPRLFPLPDPLPGALVLRDIVPDFLPVMVCHDALCHDVLCYDIVDGRGGEGV